MSTRTQSPQSKQAAREARLSKRERTLARNAARQAKRETVRRFR